MTIAPRIKTSTEIKPVAPEKLGDTWDRSITWNHGLLNQVQHYVGDPLTTGYTLADGWVAYIEGHDQNARLTFEKDGQTYDSLGFEQNYRSDAVADEAAALALKGLLFADIAEQSFQTRHQLNTQVREAKHPAIATIQGAVDALAQKYHLSVPIEVHQAS